MRTIPHPDDYYQTNKEYKASFRSAWPIEEDPGLISTIEVSVSPGDLVTWIDHPDNDMGKGKMLALRSLYFQNKTVGVVLRTRWRVYPVSSYSNLSDEGAGRPTENVYPEALVLWEDGGTTDTSHAMLKQLEEET